LCRKGSFYQDKGAIESLRAFAEVRKLQPYGARGIEHLVVLLTEVESVLFRRNAQKADDPNAGALKPLRHSD